MKLETLKEKIKNKETIYIIKYNGNIAKIKLNENYYITEGQDESHFILNNDKDMKWYFLTEIFETELAAKHYIEYQGIERIETLPYVTWEDFKTTHYPQDFRDRAGNMYILTINVNTHKIVITSRQNGITECEQFPFTEQGFYDAYDRCKEIFLMEVQEDD